MRGSLDHDIARVEAALARLEGRRDALAARAEDLTREVELAKGRLAVKDEVEAFIEAVHNSASRRNLAAFETLLTALVQEVLPGEKPVRLDLSTERGLASLDICVARPDGSLEDVLEDNGGALTNVVGMALRLISVVKADVARFLALDEADCWIAPDRVASFYRVLEDGAARLGVQCLAVSHHDLSQFSGQFHIARIEGEPRTGVRINSSDCSAAWRDELPGLRFIRLSDVQAYTDATLHLSPGVNALIGPNNRGKSTFIRALRAVFYGEARDSLVRAGAKAGTVEIGVMGGRTLRFTRQPRRTPVNIWSLHERDGAVVEEGGMRYETGGRTVPDWVGALFRITKVEDLDVHIAHQKFPVFLLGESPSRRSAVLSIGQEASYIRDMLIIHRERSARDNGLVRSGERELSDIAEKLTGLEQIGEIKAMLAAVREKAVAIEASSTRFRALQYRAAALSALRKRLSVARSYVGAASALPPPERFARLERTIERTGERERIGRRLLRVMEAHSRNRERFTALQSLPGAMPKLESTARAQELVARMRDLQKAQAILQGRVAQIADEHASMTAEMTRLVEQAGGLCPTCGSPVSAESLLNHRSHSAMDRLTA